MKKIVLTAHERAGFLQVAPLADILKQRGMFEPVLVCAVHNGAAAGNGQLAEALVPGGSEIRTIAFDQGSPVRETSRLMLEFEKIFADLTPEFVIPGGCGQSALAATLAAAAMGIAVVSIDAGLRSYDRTEQVELNRLVIDTMAAIHFVSEHSGIYNLMNEGIPDDRVVLAGNTTIDSLVKVIGDANKSGILQSLDVEPKKFATILLGMPLRPETAENLDTLCKVLESMAATTIVLFPCCTEACQGLHETLSVIPGLKAVAMPGYVEMLRILKESAFVLTDTEEFQAELTVMNVPCLTMRETTARPATIEVGTNVLVGWDEQEILDRASVILSGRPAGKVLIPEKWDGSSALRIAEVLEKAV